MSKKELRESIRASYMEQIKAFLVSQEQEVVLTNSNEFSIPCVDAEGNEDWIQIVFKMPIGSRDGEPFDGYSLAEEYDLKQKAKEKKNAEAQRKKALKMERDKASREAKAEARRKLKESAE